MINKQTRINALVSLGEFLGKDSSHSILEDWAFRAHLKNNWFTPENVLASLKAIGEKFLQYESLQKIGAGIPENTVPFKIGVVMAGNIPAVGFHDALCVLLSGHYLIAKTSSDDEVLIRFLLNKLIDIQPDFAEYVRFAERLNDADAYIATGSDNTARYFEYYFSRKPNIIRKNRVSVAVLSGEETPEQLQGLGRDILQFYGLGCRNVSKLFVPEGYDFSDFYVANESFKSYCTSHHKYFNNYEYNKSILLVNREEHLDNGFLMIRPSEGLVSPLSVVFYETYENENQVREKLDLLRDKIQCVTGNPARHSWITVPFGKAQEPEIDDYPDGVNTIDFLSNLSSVI